MRKSIAPLLYQYIYTKRENTLAVSELRADAARRRSSLFVAEGFDGVGRCGFPRRVHPQTIAMSTEYKRVAPEKREDR